MSQSILTRGNAFVKIAWDCDLQCLTICVLRATIVPDTQGVSQQPSKFLFFRRMCCDILPRVRLPAYPDD